MPRPDPLQYDAALYLHELCPQKCKGHHGTLPTTSARFEVGDINGNVGSHTVGCNIVEVRDRERPEQGHRQPGLRLARYE